MAPTHAPTDPAEQPNTAADAAVQTPEEGVAAPAAASETVTPVAFPDDIVVPPRPPLPAPAASTVSDDVIADPAAPLAASADADPSADADAGASTPAEGSADDDSSAPAGVDIAPNSDDAASADAPAADTDEAAPTGADVVADAAAPVDPTPADVAVEEPVVEQPVDAEPISAEPAATEAVDGEPAGDEAVDAELGGAEPGRAGLPADPAAPTSSGDGTAAAGELISADTPAEEADDTASTDAPTRLLDTPQVPAGEAAEGEDPTPPEVRVEELTVDETPDAPVHAPSAEEWILDADEPGVDESGDTRPGTDEPVTDDQGADDAATHDPASDVSGTDVSATDVSAADVSATDVSAADVPATDDPDLALAADTAVIADRPAAEVDPDAVPVLSLRNVSKSFGELRAVDAIDLTVPAGSFYGLVGPNGAGKTTTLSIIAGLLRADSGAVSINGVDATKRSREAKKLIGVLPDRLRTFDRLTGRQLLSYYGALRGLPAPLVESRTTDLARAFDLVDALTRPVSDYSAGMTKKVMLAGAMIHSPRLLVLDEPFEAVDPVSSGVILDILGSYVDHGGTVILSSHGMELVERVCSRVAVIVSGQVLAEGTVDEVRGEASLEERYLELAGGLGDVEGLEWLHTFSA
ncbi:ATP-binding cassette domain-containing protein [Microbacterium sp. KSW4-17]|uniref:ATP-binding cassette domain-containing protein n=1 Tax=Microbacterium galbum TaxID=3075994 RepID=A0ABU3TA47_9MICO|nr:ATP-binding cassette domain-containing protein [Microbacterium sp. KSW4-17]MDU0368246.1 ATP-binding cassette domain-containing protein [Microbacterium sp. KSW4-17]